MKWNGYPIPGSPYEVTVQQLNISPYVREYPESHCVVNQSITTILDASQVVKHKGTISKENFKIEVAYDNGFQVKLKPEEIKIYEEGEKNVFAVTFTPPKTGTYRMNIDFDNKAIPDSGLLFEVKTKVFVREYPTDQCYVNKPITLILDATNASTSVIDKRLIEAYISCDQENNVLVKVDPLMDENNVFAVTFTPHETGHYKLKLDFDKECVPEGILCFEIIKPILTSSQLTVQSFDHDDTNCLVKVKLHANDGILEGFRKCVTYDQPITSSPYHGYSTTSAISESKYAIKAVGKETGEVLYPGFYQERNNEYSILISTAVPDLYMLYVHYYGELLQCCPFPVDITTKVVTYDPVIPFEVGTSNYIELVLDTSNGVKTSATDFNVKVFSDTTQSFFTASVVEESPDLFRASFLPQQYGDFKIEVSWFCLPISNSPLFIPFKQRATRPRVTVNFPPNMGSRVSISVVLSKGPEAYHADFYPQAEMSSDIKDSTDNTGLPKAELSFSALPEDDAGVLSDKRDDKQSDGGSNGSYSLQDPFIPEVAVQQYKRGYYEISFLEHQERKYYLHVYCLGQEIKGSPFLINLSLMEKPHSMEDELKSVKVRVERSHVRMGGYGILSASVKGQAIGPVPITLKVTPDLDLAVIQFKDTQFKNTQRDIYELRMYWNYVQFQGAPFLLTKHHESAARKTKARQW